MWYEPVGEAEAYAVFTWKRRRPERQVVRPGIDGIGALGLPRPRDATAAPRDIVDDLRLQPADLRLEAGGNALQLTTFTASSG